jgi:SAM-dependent methyltransferase
MLYHASDRRRAIEECRRVLAAGGRLYATTSHPENGRALFDLVSTAAGGEVEPLSRTFDGERGATELATVFDSVDRRCSGTRSGWTTPTRCGPWRPTGSTPRVRSPGGRTWPSSSPATRRATR